ncbi:MAG: cell division ATP-binding protein FtsE [Candidatus Paceibacterota bacterium]
MIYFEEVSKVYPDESWALDEVTFSIEPNEFISIVGHSGAGKTTLLKMLIAEECPTKGSVMVSSQEVHKLKGEQINQLRRRVGIIFQDFRLLPYKTVYENVAFAMEVAGRSDEEIHSDVPYALDLVGIGNKMWNFPNELSGGEKQRVAIARAIVNQPEIVIADEPTGNLDPENTYEIVQILKRINDLETTVIIATHNTGVIESLDNRTLVLESGRVVQDDKSSKRKI